ncbi:MAG: hypothetical protein JWN70_783 [Planctomycetaceae bacterium]|nr:hypothetical protein [Planctomycetaceae bacterium]
MGIDTFIEFEDGEPKGDVLDPDDLTAQLLDSVTASTSCCLCFIDRYGDTTFNQLQIPVLIEELQQATNQASDPKVKSHGQALLALALRARSEIHTYVKFYGD